MNQDSISTWMSHFTFLDYMMMIYISAFFIFMFKCIYMMLLILITFKILKKMNVFCIFYDFSRLFPIFSPMLPRSCNQDPRRLFAKADFFNIDLKWLHKSHFMINWAEKLKLSHKVLNLKIKRWNEGFFSIKSLY